MRVAAEAADFEVVERVTQRRRRLRRPLVAEHALIPRLACQTIGFCLRASLARSADARIELPYIDSRDLVPMRVRMRPQDFA